eukprot:2030692-Rhodomonas_salina.1
MSKLKSLLTQREKQQTRRQPKMMSKDMSTKLAQIRTHFHTACAGQVVTPCGQIKGMDEDWKVLQKVDNMDKNLIATLGAAAVRQPLYPAHPVYPVAPAPMVPMVSFPLHMLSSDLLPSPAPCSGAASAA